MSVRTEQQEIEYVAHHFHRPNLLETSAVLLLLCIGFWKEGIILTAACAAASILALSGWTTRQTWRLTLNASEIQLTNRWVTLRTAVADVDRVKRKWGFRTHGALSIRSKSVVVTHKWTKKTEIRSNFDVPNVFDTPLAEIEHAIRDRCGHTRQSQ